MAQVADEPFTDALRRPPASCPPRPPSRSSTPYSATTIGYSTPFAPPDAMGDTTYIGPRTDALSALEQSYGAETYFDADGDFVFAEKPGDDEPVVWTSTPARPA